MSLRNGTQKMSKSDVSDMTRINLIDCNDTISEKIKKAKTDSGDFPVAAMELDERPEIKNLINIYASISGKKVEQIVDHFSSSGFAKFKVELTEILINEISPIRKIISELMAETQELDKILEDGAKKASLIAKPVMKEVFDVIGFNKRGNL